MVVCPRWIDGGPIDEIAGQRFDRMSPHRRLAAMAA
jgi:hypothetical protein